jgi:hypothetical protein
LTLIVSTSTIAFLTRNVNTAFAKKRSSGGGDGNGGSDSNKGSSNSRGGSSDSGGNSDSQSTPDSGSNSNNRKQQQQSAAGGVDSGEASLAEQVTPPTPTSPATAPQPTTTAGTAEGCPTGTYRSGSTSFQCVPFSDQQQPQQKQQQQLAAPPPSTGQQNQQQQQQLAQPSSTGTQSATNTKGPITTFGPQPLTQTGNTGGEGGTASATPTQQTCLYGLAPITSNGICASSQTPTDNIPSSPTADLVTAGKSKLKPQFTPPAVVNYRWYNRFCTNSHSSYSSSITGAGQGISPTPATPPASNTPTTPSPPAIPSQPECVPGYHRDSSQKQCVPN